MKDFVNDVIQHVESYYKTIIDVTPRLVLAIIVILLSWLVASRVRSYADKRLKKRMHDPLLAIFMANLLKLVFIIAGILLMFRIIGLTGIAGTILAGAGISAFIIGFALKDIGENFLAGILLAFKRPFTVGDIIESNAVKGKVISLNLRDTQIKSDGKDIYIPNAMLVKSILTNFTSEGYLLQEIVVGLEYGADYNKALELVKSLLDAHNAGLDAFKNTVDITATSGSTVQLNVRYWVNADQIDREGHTRSDWIVKILDTLHNNGFNIK